MFSADENQEKSKVNHDSDVDEDMPDNDAGANQKYIPYKFSGKHFSFSKDEMDILDGLRGWVYV